MKKLLSLLVLLTTTMSVMSQTDFKTQQLKFERVSEAYAEKWESLEQALSKGGFKGKINLYLVAYKAEGKLEVWIKSEGQNQYRIFRVYDFCAHSGTLGPKTKEGDLQTPEGFYYINVFNPQSRFHLSLGINYPNAVDKVRSGSNKPGYDIYIHGKCVTEGCIPLTDDKIKELYVLGVEALNSGQTKIPVHIFPFRMTDENLNRNLQLYPLQKAFWRNIQTGYAHFQKNKKLPVVTQLEAKYIFK